MVTCYYTFVSSYMYTQSLAWFNWIKSDLLSLWLVLTMCLGYYFQAMWYVCWSYLLTTACTCTCNTIINCGVTTMYLSNPLPLFKAYVYRCVSVHDAILCSAIMLIHFQTFSLSFYMYTHGSLMYVCVCVRLLKSQCSIMRVLMVFPLYQFWHISVD